MEVVSRVFIVDDHPIVRRGLAELIDQEPDLAVCGEAAAPAAATKSIAELVPDLVIVDLSLGQQDGIPLIRDLRERFAGLPVLVLTMHDEPQTVQRAIQSGAAGYLTKRDAAAEVLAAIRSLLDGRIYLGERVRNRADGGPIRFRMAATESPPEVLTPREFQVFLLVGRGLSTRQVADELTLSTKTIETHYERIKHKLALRDATQLTRNAMLWVLEHEGY